jgi:hypothetical protein
VTLKTPEEIKMMPKEVKKKDAGMRHQGREFEKPCDQGCGLRR